MSGAAKRKQRKLQLENKAKTRRTLEDLNWCIKATTSDQSRSQESSIEKDNEFHSIPHVATTTNTSTGLNEHQESFKEERICNLDENDKYYTTKEETDNTITETDTSQMTTMN